MTNVPIDYETTPYEMDWAAGALYLRISLDRTGEGLGVARQESDCRKLADLQRVRVGEVFSDNDISAAGTKVRPDFERLLKAIETGSVKVVIAWAMDRLTRNARDFLRLSELGQRTGLRILFVTGSPIDFSDPNSRALAEVASTFARLEIDQKSLRQRRANLQRAQEGVPIPGRKAFGYEHDGVTVRTLRCPECAGSDGFTIDRACVACGADAVCEPGSEAAAIERAYDDVLAQVGLMRIAKDWNGQGFRTRSGKLWDHRTVAKVLLNPRYAGLYAYNGKIMGRAQWAPIVPEARYRAVVAVLTGPARQQAPKTGKMLLSGIATCSKCGQAIHYSAPHAGYRRYRCPPGCVQRRADEVEAYVVGHVVSRLSRPDAHDLLDTGTEAIDIGRLQTDRAASVARQAELADLFAQGTVTAAQLTTGTQRAAADIAAIDEKLAEAGRMSVLGPLIGAADVLAAWRALDMERQRGVIRALMTVVVHPPGKGARVFNPATVVVTWRVAEGL